MEWLLERKAELGDFPPEGLEQVSVGPRRPWQRRVGMGEEHRQESCLSITTRTGRVRKEGQQVESGVHNRTL